VRFRTKLLLPTISTSLLLILFIIIVGVLVYRNLEIQNQARDKLARASAALVLSSAIDSLASTAKIIDVKKTLANALDLENQFEVLDFVSGYSDNQKLNFVNVYDRYLALFARSDNPGDFGHNDELHTRLIKSTKSKSPSYFVAPYQNELAIIHVVPIYSINGFSGALVVGRYINHSFLNVIQGDHHLEMQVMYAGLPWGDQHIDGKLMDVGNIEQLVDSDISFQLKVPDQEEYAELLSTLANILAIVVFTTCIILYLSYKSLKHISDQIEFVSKGVPLLAKGNFPETTDHVSDGDDISSMIFAIQTANRAINKYTAELNNALKDKIQVNTELEYAKNAAVEMAIAKSQFLSNMSHEIRTPMNGVLGLLELIDINALKSDDKELVKTAKQSGKDLIRIVNDILIFSKLDVDKDELELRTFCLKEEMERDVRLLAPAFEDNGIYFSVQMDIDEECKWVHADSTRLGQVVKNLLGNAIKFGATGGTVHYQVRCCTVDKENAQLSVDVVDEGIGIEADQIPSLFEGFKQADGSMSRRFGGTGLGLAICRKLVELMGGNISVESKVGQGSRFYFSIPIKIASAPAIEVTQKPPPIVGKNLDLEGKRNLLLVEDNKVNAMVARGLLKKMGLKADLALDGQEALDALKNKTYHLILMDCQMPVMDGYEATKRIREQKLDVAIVAMTANAMPGDREKCLSVGMDDYIAKPLGMEKFAQVIEKWLFATSSEGGDAPKQNQA